MTSRSILQPNPMARFHLACLSVVLSTLALPAHAQDVAGEDPPPPPAPDTDQPLLKPMTVIGSKAKTFDLPGSGYYVDTEEIRSQNSANINRILAKVPGVYVREEDGFGNFPNISLRGADGTRSEKTTVMEDGILSAPATYSAPGAYYSPRAGRMHGIEVLKGSSQVRYGPHTTGGVLNYLSTPIPGERELYGRFTYGSDSTMLGHFHYGNTVETEAGQIGYLLELFAQASDGFRKIQPGRAYGGSDDTGFDVYEPMVKISWQPKTAMAQRFEFKYGFTDLDADESYTGLSESDVDRHPDWRYAATRFDNIQTEHDRTYLKYVIEPVDHLRLEAAGYYNEFSRNWYKLDGIHRVDGSPEVNSVREALLDANGLAFLQGRTGGESRVRANNRDYVLYGFQLVGDWDFETADLEHEVHFGGRVHYDEIRRFQRDDRIVQDAEGAVTEVVRGVPGSGGNRFQESTAIALWVEDRVTFGRLSLTPGIRYETIDQDFIDYASDPANSKVRSGSDTYDYIVPGVSLSFDLTETEQVFGGVFRGVSVPGPRSAIRSGIDLEESIGYELGLRTRRDKGFAAEVGWFYTGFDNLIGSNAGTGEPLNVQNAGEADVWGIEGGISYDLAGSSEYDFALPVYVTGTYTDAEFGAALSGGGGDGIYAGATDGAEIPYVPDLQFACGLGLHSDVWGLDLDLTYHSDTFGTANNFDDPVDSARQGEIDELLLLDLAGYYQVNEVAKLIGGVSNLTDERGIVSRVPRGPRTNIGRHFWVGVELTY